MACPYPTEIRADSILLLVVTQTLLKELPQAVVVIHTYIEREYRKFSFSVSPLYPTAKALFSTTSVLALSHLPLQNTIGYSGQFSALVFK